MENYKQRIIIIIPTSRMNSFFSNLNSIEGG